MIPNEFQNYLPNTMTIKVLSRAYRISHGKFIDDDDKCKRFIILARESGFSSNEAVNQINTERKYISDLKEKNAIR